MSAAARPRTFSVPNPWEAALGLVLGRLRAGELTVLMPDGRELRFAGAAEGPRARIAVRDRTLARRIATGGSLALGEAYMDGVWDTPDLGAVLALGLTNITSGAIPRMPVALRPLQRAWHSLRDNDPDGGSRRNVAYHYDLGNDFYSLWLDETMTYSAARPPDGAVPVSDEALERAQRAKWDRILELVQPGASDRILEIGCGWGGFAMHAARESGCRVTGITLSERQAEFARARVAEAGLEGRVDIRIQDYREVTGTFDGIASIEMFEAVGERWWRPFFTRTRELLEPGRAAAMQVITIAEDRFEAYRRRPDFIQRFIFPGGMLPSPERFKSVAEESGLAVGEPDFFGPDYARTLSAWAERFEDALPSVRRLGFDERFVRMWRYYLAYCRAGFEHGTIDVMQVRLAS